jgi:hypothetical protein
MWARAGSAYRNKVGKELTAHGLMYEDALVETEEVKLALSRLPGAVFNAREQRLKRAMVLSCSQKTLPPDVAAQIDPFESYLGAPRALACARLHGRSGSERGGAFVLDSARLAQDLTWSKSRRSSRSSSQAR